MSLLVVGSVAFDGLESPYGKVERTLGGAATYFSVAASFFTPVHLVAIVGDDFTDMDAKMFHGRNIDCEGLERTAGKTFFWAGRYSENLNERVTLTTELNVFADFKPKLPETLSRVRIRFSGKHRSRPAARCFAAGEEKTENRRARHHELLDRAHQRRFARDPAPRRYPDDQRRGNAPTFQ